MTTDPPVVADLTPVLRSIAVEIARDGATNATIGRRVHLAPGTVAIYVGRILAATGMPNRTALALALVRGELKIRTVDQRTDRRRAA